MSSGSAHVTLLRTKQLVEDFRKENRIGNFSEALRYIIEDYFRLRKKLDEARHADFEKVCDLLAGKGGSEFNGAVVEDLDEIKSSLDEVRKMVLVIGHTDAQFRPEFAKYFPKYFKNHQE